jgi:hypothetical protein
MDRHLDELRARIEGLTGELREMRLRLDTLEARVRAASGAEPEETPPPDLDVSQAEATARLTPTRTVPLIGRTLVVLGGAFLLRAITDNALAPAVIGAAAGLMYAAWWLVQADRSAAAGPRQSAVFHGFATAMIAYPLVWETTARFGLLDPNAAGAALLFFLALGLAVAWRRELWEIAWTITLFTVVTAIALAVGTREFLSFTTVLLVAAVAVEMLAYRDRWLGLRWPIALGLDLAVLMLTSATLSSFGQEAGAAALAPGGVIALCMALPLLYLGSIGARTLLRGCPITPFEVTQAGAALLVGFSGAVRVISVSGADPMFVGVVGLVLGAACYAAALTFIDRRSGRGRNFYSYTTLAGLLVLTGSSLILGRVALTLTWSALAVVAIGLGGRFDRITLKFHGAVYLGVAAAGSGLIVCAYYGLFADPTGTWEPAKPVGVAVTFVAAVCYGILVATRGETVRPWFELLPQTFVGAVAVWGVGGMTAGLASAPIVAAAGSDAGAAFVAASRTAVIAILAVTLAWSGRRWSLQELTWFAYPLLVAGGAKLLWEDLHYDQPVTLFLALALYGGALIVTPRLLRTSRSDSSPIEAG